MVVISGSLARAVFDTAIFIEEREREQEHERM
jgi:hypothetical protein